MNDNHIVIGIFENELYAVIAKRDLRDAGIKAKILREGAAAFLPLLSQIDGVPIIVPDTQAEGAKKILKTKFI